MIVCQTGKTCRVSPCGSLRQIISHWKNCSRQQCPDCELLRIKPGDVTAGQGPQQASQAIEPGNTQPQQQNAQPPLRSPIVDLNNLPPNVVALTAGDVLFSAAPEMQNDAQRMPTHGALKRGLDVEINSPEGMIRGSVQTQIQGMRPKYLRMQMIGVGGLTQRPPQISHAVSAGHRQPIPNQIPQQQSAQQSPNPNMRYVGSFHMAQSEAESLLKFRMQPGAIVNVDGVSVSPSEGTKDWHQNVTNDVRTHYVQQIVHAAIASSEAFNIQNERVQQFARKIEDKTFNAALSTTEYGRLIAKKILKIQKEFEEKRLQRRQHPPQGSQPVTASSYQQQHQQQQTSEALDGTQSAMGPNSDGGTFVGPRGPNSIGLPIRIPTQQQQVRRMGTGVMMKPMSGNDGGVIRDGAPSSMLMSDSPYTSRVMISPAPITSPTRMAPPKLLKSHAYNKPPSGPMGGPRDLPPLSYISRNTLSQHKLPKPTTSTNGVGPTHMQQLLQLISSQ